MLVKQITFFPAFPIGLNQFVSFSLDMIQYIDVITFLLRVVLFRFKI
jgi:hypothetical protein